MKVLKARVVEYIVERGLRSIQIDGIPEGFSFKEPDITIGGKDIIGDYIAFIPKSDWVVVKAKSTEELLKEYKKEAK